MTIDASRATSRRNFLKLATGLGAWAAAPDAVKYPAWMPRMAFAPPGVEPPGDILVAIFQRGGMDGLNAVIPHGDADYYHLRSALAIAEPASGTDTTGIDLDGFFGLHPALRPLKDLWDDKALAIVHAVGSPDPTHSHFDAMDYMERGTPGEKQIATGWIGRHLQTAPWHNDSPFRAIGMGGIMQASLRGPVPVTTLQSIADFHLQGRTQDLARIQQTLAALYNQGSNLDAAAATTFSATDLLAGIDVTHYTPAGGAAYPETEFGMACKQVAQITKAQIGMEIACIDIGGWDTHNHEGGLDGELPTLLGELAGGVAALYHDLGDLAKRVTLVTMSEFGRRAYENDSGGTDHGHGNVMFVAGGSVNGGKVYGDWPGLAQDKLYATGDLAVTTDFRDVLGEIVQKRLGNPDNLAQIFPEYTGWKMRSIVAARS
jgi:uncharacterized protein (DUF1501 family)